MFICNECGLVFEEVKVIKEPRPYGMGVSYEEIYVCPHCEDTDIVEAKQCSRCDEFVAELDEGLCGACCGDLYGK